jgi:hypothetical protein
VLVAGPSVQTIFARRPPLMSSLTCLLAALVYTTVASGGPAAQAGQAQFTEQSSDVRTRYLADIAALPGPAGPAGPAGPPGRLRRQPAGPAPRQPTAGRRTDPHPVTCASPFRPGRPPP